MKKRNSKTIVKKPTSLLRLDPTRTGTLRNGMEREIVRRFSEISKAILVGIGKEDWLGLTKSSEPLTNSSQEMVTHTRFKFLSDPEKTEAFRGWLKNIIEVKIKSATVDTILERYVRMGYRKGTESGYRSARRKGSTEKRSELGLSTPFEKEFIHTELAGRATVDKLKSLTARVLTDLDGITDEMETRIMRVLADGLVRGKLPLLIAEEMLTVVDLSKTRACTLARTEIVRAHAEGTLDTMERLGVEEVGIALEWETTGKPCPACKPMDGIILKISEARGMIPRHPNCRCAWVTVDPSRHNKRNRKSIVDSAIRRSRKKGKDDFGPGKPISKDRPIGLLNSATPDYPGLREISNLLIHGVTSSQEISAVGEFSSLLNVFCPTGVGGGIDPTCSPSGSGVIKDKSGVVYKVHYDKENRTYTIGVPGKEDMLERGVTAGGATLKRDMKTVSSVGIYPEFRRKGLATALYDHIEKHLGAKLEENWATTPDGEEFWKARKGKVENVFCPTGTGGGVDPTCSPGKTFRESQAKVVYGADMPEFLQTERNIALIGLPVYSLAWFEKRNQYPRMTDSELLEGEYKYQMKAAELATRYHAESDEGKKFDLQSLWWSEESKRLGFTQAIQSRNVDKDFATRLFGLNSNGEPDVASAVGALDDAEIKVHVYGKLMSGDQSVKIEVTHRKYTATRLATLESGGSKVMSNQSFFVGDDYQSEGIGAKVFSTQVAALKAKGFDSIKTIAGKSADMNGYYTWARFGYDQQIDQFTPKVQKRLLGVFPEAKSVQDIMKVPVVSLDPKTADSIRRRLKNLDKELGRPVKDRPTISGRDWWLVKGSQMESARFDLREGSRSLEILSRYLSSKSQTSNSYLGVINVSMDDYLSSSDDDFDIDPTENRPLLESEREVISLSVSDELRLEEAWKVLTGDVLNVFCPTGKGGGVDPTCSPGGSSSGSFRESKAEVTYATSRNPTEPSPEKNKELARKLFGVNSKGEPDVASGVGALDDAKVKVVNSWIDPDTGAEKLWVEVTHPKYVATREISLNPDGTKTVYNNSFFVGIQFQGEGIGADVFSNQAKALSAKGFDKITTQAARDASMNGHYTWPRLGYDQPIEEFNQRNQAKIKKEFPNAKSVQDILRTPAVFLDAKEDTAVRAELAEIDKRLKKPPKNRQYITGSDWWLVRGMTIPKAEFDLKEGSPSMELLNKYLESKPAKKTNNVANSSTPEDIGSSGGEQIHLTSEQEKRLDAIWDEIVSSATPEEGK